MGLPRLTSCCWVLDLKTGNVVLGTLNAVLSFGLVVAMIVEASRAASVEGSLDAAEDDAKQAGALEGAAETLMEADKRAELTGRYALTVLLAIMFTAKLAFDIFFVYGVVKERAGVIKAYFVMWLVFFLLSSFTFSIHVMQYSGATVCMELFYLSLNVYAILLCHSFYRQLNEREEV